jgi:pimeloyl-ACP methyl ester carboxylesterase
MKTRRALGLSVGLLFLAGLAVAPGCGSSDEDIDFTTASSGGNPSGSSTSGSATSTGTGGGGGSVAGILDPDKDGPYEYKEIDDTITSPSGNQVPIHCAYPTAGPDAGPYPVVVVAHGLQLTPDLYDGYIKRLATFGYVALTADFPANAFGGEVNNTKNAQDLIAALDWADQESKAAGSPLEGKADANLAGMTGHSLGGKLALLAALQDARVKASITLDPVDGGGGPGGGCAEPQCVDVSAKMMALKIPTGFLGETLDETGQFGQACAPKDQNYTTFFAPAPSPSFAVTVTGAGHMSFIDNPDCGFACFACKTASADHAKVIGLARAYVVAFYERHLRGVAGYDTYLTGAEAKLRYVDSGLASIESK